MHAYRYHIRQTIKLAYPVTIGQLGHVMLGVADSVMVGKVGATPLAASSLVNGLVFLVLVFGLGMTLGVTPLVAIARGKEDHTRCGIILRQALLVNGILGVGISVSVYLMADLVFYLNQPAEVAIQAASYAKIISFSLLPFMIFQNYRQFIEGLSFTKPAMYITILANVLNVFGNWVFIYGNLGFQAYGLDGAGYSTFFTRIFMAIVMLVFVLRSKRFKQYDPSFRFRSINRKVIKQLLNIGVPSGFLHFFEFGAFSFSAVMIGWLGKVQLAAHQIALSLASISFMFIMGISAAGTIRVGNALGRDNLRDVRDSGFSAIFFGALIMACFGALFISLRNFLPNLYISDVAVIRVAASLLIVAAFFQISDGVQAVGLGVLRGITDVKIPMIISFIAYWAIGLPVGYFLGFKMKYEAVGVWIGLLCGLTVAATFFFLRFQLKTKKLAQV